MEYKVYVTKGELQTIMGVLAFGTMVRTMETSMGELGLTVLASLDRTTGLYLDNPEIIDNGGLIDTLVGTGAVTAETAQKVRDYVTTKLADLNGGQTSYNYNHRYRVPVAGIEQPISWVGQFLTSDNTISLEGEFLVIDTNGDCTAPGTIIVY